MEYIVCQEPGKFVLANKDVPVRKEGEVLLKIKKVGICGTDLHAYGGNQAFFTYPRILGHELASEVLEVGEETKGLKKGDRVVVMPYISCGTCVSCRKGKTNCCSNIQVLGVHTDGGMQEIISVPASLLIPANHLSFDQIAVVEPLAIGGHAIRRSDLQKGDTVVVIGCGPIGIGIMKLAQIAGANVIAIDVSEERLNYAKDKIGVDHVVNALDNPVEKVAQITNNDLAAVVYDASGNKHALELGVQYMSHGGKFVLVGLSIGDLTFNHPAIHAKETTIMCSRNATFDDFHYIMEVLSSGRFPVDAYITHRAPYTAMIAHFDSWLDPKTGVMKAMTEYK